MVAKKPAPKKKMPPRKKKPSVKKAPAAKKPPTKKKVPPRKKVSKPKKLGQAPWMKVAYSLYGTKEAKGRKNNKEIVGWASVIGGRTFKSFTHDAIPWCGLYTAYSCVEGGIKDLPTNPLWARDWGGKWGINIEKRSAPPVGTILVFKRGKGGHVGFCVGMTSSKRGRGYYLVLGGNQSDAVTVMAISKQRCLAWRWPPKMSKWLPKTHAPVMSLKQAKVKVSRNEA